MSKRSDLEEQLSAIEGVRADPDSPETIDTLRSALSKENHLVVGKAAQLTADLELEMLEADLIAAFDRLMLDPVETDPGCRAKVAIAEALNRLGSREEGPFLRGVRHIQLEPVYGGKEDTAGQLRAVCALGLARLDHPEAMLEFAHLLADGEFNARLGAVRAIAMIAGPGAMPLLLFKTLTGDKDPRVLHECFRALLRLSPQESLTFVGSYLYAEEEPVCEAAALALGDSRLDGAFEVLRAWVDDQIQESLREIGLTAVALLRSDMAFEYLLSLVSEGSEQVSKQAVSALEMYQGDPRRWERVQEALQAREEGS